VPSYPSVNLEGPPEPAKDAPKPPPSPVVEYRAHRDAFASDAPCSQCGKPCSTFADAVHEDGSVSGWVRICEECSPRPKKGKLGTAVKAPEPSPAESTPDAPPVTPPPSPSA